MVTKLPVIQREGGNEWFELIFFACAFRLVKEKQLELPTHRHISGQSSFTSFRSVLQGCCVPAFSSALCTRQSALRVVFTVSYRLYLSVSSHLHRAGFGVATVVRSKHTPKSLWKKKGGRLITPISKQPWLFTNTVKLFFC